MAKSKITIKFNSMPVQGQRIRIANSLSSVELYEQFTHIRYQSQQVTIPQENPNYNPGDPGDPEQIEGGTMYFGNVADNYGEAIRIDYNATGLYNVGVLMSIDDYTQGLGTAVIFAVQSNVVFSVVENNADATITIENETETEAIKVTNVTYTQAASDLCNKVKINVQTNVLASTINGQPNSTNPATLDMLRELKTQISLTDASGNTVYHLVATPGKLVTTKLSVGVTNTPNGATVTVSGTQINGLVLEFSMNNTNWQTSNIFSGIASGTYTMYVRDQLGCSVQKAFTVISYTEAGSGVGINNPVAILPSKANSIRYKKEVTWADCGPYKIDENTLSCEVDVPMLYKEFQRFQTCDNETTQIKTNYANIASSIIDPDAPDSFIPVFKQSNYMNQKDKRDAIRYKLDDARAGVYFMSGDVYDFDTSLVTGTYDLNGGLPKWAVIGNYVQVNNVWFLISSILYDEQKFAEVIVIEDAGASGDESVQIGSIYNIFNYEVYEFDTNFALYGDKRIQVKIHLTDDRFDDVVFISEVIDVKTRQEGTVEIAYHNESNTDINFGTGIRFKIRVPYLQIRGISEDANELHKTDNSVMSLSAELYEGDEFEFEPMSKEMWRKLMIALSHSHVYIDGQGRVKTGSFSTEGPLGETNLYSLTATMLKTDYTYASYDGAIYIDGSEQEVPSIVSLDDTEGFAEL